MAAAYDKNILVISDLHLGEDLRPVGKNVSYLRYLAKLERELANFLEHHTNNRLDARPWCLVINGDMVDFMSVKIMPEVATDGEGDDPEDRLYGLGFGERQSQKKLEKIIARHPTVFKKLASFVAAGNELVIVVGNHDVEFQYETVQKTLVEWLCGFANGAGAEANVREQFAAQIQFCPWFFYREDFIYIEHGHQYDEYCSFDYSLHPVAERRKAKNGKKSKMALSIAHAGMRYFGNQLPDYDPHTAEQWGVLNYARWAWAQGIRGAIRVSFVYGLMVWRVVELWFNLRGRVEDAERRALHARRLKLLCAGYQIEEQRVVALDNLRRLPVTKNFFKMMQALFIDRVLLFGAAGMAILAALVWAEGWSKLATPIALLGGIVGINYILSHFRLETSASRLRRAPELIAELMPALFIVFGHSHSPESVELSGGGRYFNTGTWASEEEASAFTHLRVIHCAEKGGMHAELRQWRNGESAPYHKLSEADLNRKS